MRLLLAAALLAVSLTACQDEPAPPAATTTTVVERVVTPAGEHREVTDVDRPYRARLRVYSPAGKVTGGFAWTESGVFTLSAAGGPQRSQELPPGRPGPDSYLDVALGVALAQGLVRRDGTATVAGRPCTWWVSRLPLSSGAPALPSGGDSARSCVDAGGLVLSSQETAGGTVVATRTVVSVTTTAPLTDEELFGGPAPTGGLGLLRVKVLPGAAPSPPLAVSADAPGPGWSLASGAVTATLSGPGGDVVLTSDRTVFVKDGRLAVLDERQDQVQRPTPPSVGEVVEIGSLGQGRLTSGFDGLTLRALTRNGVLVTLTGALTRQEILAWGASLRVG